MFKNKGLNSLAAIIFSSSCTHNRPTPSSNTHPPASISIFVLVEINNFVFVLVKSVGCFEANIGLQKLLRQPKLQTIMHTGMGPVLILECSYVGHSYEWKFSVEMQKRFFLIPISVELVHTAESRRPNK